MIRRLFFAALVAVFALPAHAQDEPPLETLLLDGIRTCMSIAGGRTTAEASAIFGLTLVDGALVREVRAGKIEVLPPSGDRRSCRTQLYALDIDLTVVWESVKDFLTTPPQAYAPLQSRIAESLGSYASRTSIWAASGGSGGVAMVTLYEVLAHEYYHGPKVLVDYLISAD